MKKANFKQFKSGPVNIIVLMGILIAGIWALTQLTEFTRTTHSIIYSAFRKYVENGMVKEAHVLGNKVYGKFKDGHRFETEVPRGDQALIDTLYKNNVDIAVESPSSGDFGLWHILLLLSFIMTPLIIWYFLRQSRNSGTSGGNIFSMSKSKARMFMPNQIKVNFNSVAGAAEAKEELQDVVDFLKNPDKYKKLGARLTRGILLVGEPGNGKTLLARAVAGEANCPFFSVSGSDFIEVFVGVGAARVRDLFAQARRHAPSIIFIDEIDAVGRQRGSGLGGGHDEREQTLNQLLIEMDGFDSAASSVVVIAATNRSDILDKALLRPGRFDRRIDVPYPDLVSREEILRVHASNVKIAKDLDLKKIARGTPGFTGADLENLINEAAIIASKDDKEQVTVRDFEEARDKILLGKENKTITLLEEERTMTAFHEAGHALVSLLMPGNNDPLHKVTIMPRGKALGVTHRMPERDKHTMSKDEMMADIMVALGGRVAEEVVFNRLEVGAYSDFQKATQIARRMVCNYGMSKALGPIVYQQAGPGEYQYSEETSRLIDHEVRSIIEECYQKTVALLTENRQKLDKLALELVDKETLYADEIYQLLDIPARESHRWH
jgi:cell division protease FtsH